VKAKEIDAVTVEKAAAGNVETMRDPVLVGPWSDWL